MTPEQFLAVAGALPEAMMLVSRSGTVLAANDATRACLELPPSEARGRRLSSLVGESAQELASYLRACSRSRELVLGALSMQREGGEPVVHRVEGCVLRPGHDGAEALLLLRLAPRTAATLSFVALNQRIADLDRQVQRRRKAESLARQQEERLRTTLMSIGDGVIVTDSEGRIDTLNRVAESLTGWTNEEARGHPLEEVFHIVNETTRAAVENPALRALEQGVIVGLANHTVLISKDGAEWPIDDSAAPIREERGAVVGAVLVFREISRRRQVEGELREANRRKDEFLALLAHELRNPLAPIRSCLELMRLAGDDRAALESARSMMERQLAQLVRLVDDILDVSRMSRDKIRLRREPIDLARVVELALEASAPRIEEQRLALVVTLPDVPLEVDVDPTRIAQALGNLLSNAVKYTSEGGRIEVEVQGQERTALVRIRDDGIGIPADLLPHVFDMFVQGDLALEKAQGGLGLGLTICKRLIEIHGGSIEARSEGRGRGSEFVVRLPLADAAASAVAPTPGREADAPLRARRILVVDDNRDAAISMAAMLRLMGHETHVAHDGLEAVAAALELLPDVVLLDIGMPRVDGYEACRRIREHPRGREMALVALTGWGQETDKARSREAGFDHHLVKPVDPQALQQLIAALPRPAAG